MNKIEVIENALPHDVEQAYLQVREGALLQIRSFKVVRSRAKIKSNIIRGFAFSLLCLGIIIPLFYSLFKNSWEKWFSFDPLSVGYMAIALGGLCTLTDQIFGLSETYSNIRSLEMRLIGMLRDLDFGWSIRRVKLDPSAKVDPVADLQALYEFRRMFDEANASQVAERIAQRQAASELLSSRLAAAQPRASSDA